MIKKTLYFGNPAHLSLDKQQLIIKLPEVEKDIRLPSGFKESSRTTIPVEDIGVIFLDHNQITITQALIAALMENNTAVIVSNNTHHPVGMLLPLDVHYIQHERFKHQISASVPLKKQLWQQTVQCKIRNQGALLKKMGKDPERLYKAAGSVKSGDPSNVEGQAANYYWDQLFHSSMFFTRRRDGDPPNNLLNYGYAILRAIMARSLTGSGLLPTLGIHHSNKYNAYCLADDIMEPYRPYVDELVIEIASRKKDLSELTPEIKKELLSVSFKDIYIEDEKSPLMIGMQRTTASLAQCFEGIKRKIAYPVIT